MKAEIELLKPMLAGENLRLGEESEFPEGSGFEIEAAGRKKPDPESVRIYILQRLVDELGVIAGLVFKKGEQTVFVPREANQSTEKLPWFLKLIVGLGENLRMGDGQVFMKPLSGETPLHVRTTGDMGNNPKLDAFIPSNFTVPTRGKNARRVVTAINRDDSFGKEEWRKNISRFVENSLSYHNASGDYSRVLCFPGLGKEAHLWSRTRVSPDQMFFIERNRQIAERLAKQFPESNIFPAEFGADREMTRKKIIDPLVAKLKNEKRKAPQKDFWIINFDPEGGLTQKFYGSMVDLFRAMPLGDACCIGVNFTGKREQQQQIRFYQALHPAALKCNLTLAQLRDAAVHKAVPAALKEAGKDYEIQTHIGGSYEGESDGSRMYYAMHHFIKK